VLEPSSSATLTAVRPRVFPYPIVLLVGLWMIAATVLASVTGRVTDWYVMTDELVYERLAISIARTGSPVPRVHGVFVRSLDQLYPLVIAPLFVHGSVAHDIKEAHVLGAFLMSSACIPAFLLAWRVSGRTWLAWVLALGSIAIPWTIYSSFLLTETIAYPLFLWAVLAIQRAVAAPSVRADVLVLVALLLAFLARTELIVLAAVPPVAALLVEAGSASAPWRTRVSTTVRRAVSRHKLLTVAYAAALAAAVGFTAAGGDVLRLSVYGQEIPSQTVPNGYGQAVLGHFAQLAFGLGVLPLVVGFAWLLANVFSSRASPEARVFACVGASAIVFVVLEVAKYDLGLGTIIIFDRYLFYLAPIVLLAFSCAVLDSDWPRWSLVVPAALVCLGFAFRSQASFTWQAGHVNPDSPVSILYHPLLEALGSRARMDAALVAGTIALTGMFAVLATRAPRHRRLGPALIALAVLLTSLETGYVFVRLFRQNGLSDRPLTAAIPPSFSWVDAALGPHANVAFVPYHVSSDYLVSERYWRDLEFWNKSVDRDVDYPSEPYDFTGIWFPKLDLSFDPRDGRASVSPSRYVVQAITDVRFGLAGVVKDQDPQGGQLIEADLPWRASFLTFGTYDDGWLKPHTPAVVRVFPAPGQKRARIRYLTLQFQAPSGIAARRFTVRSNVKTLRGSVTDLRTTFVDSFPVCVPARGSSEVTVTARGASTIPGDLSSYASSLGSRIGSIYMADASVNNLGPECTA
jgi:hypothetical protein